MPLHIIHQDEHLVAVHKPAGMLVHRSWIASQERVFLLQLLRDQLGQRVYPVHRLDRPTSGLQLFALSSEIAGALGRQWMTREVGKAYVALVRGWTEEGGEIDHALDDPESGIAARPAITRYRRLGRIELPFGVDRYPTSRYSLVRAEPLTGRRHQLRRHLKHIAHPIIGDTTYGKSTHNRFIAGRYALQRLLLVSVELRFTHPVSREPMKLTAEPEPEWRGLLSEPDWEWDEPIVGASYARDSI